MAARLEPLDDVADTAPLREEALVAQLLDAVAQDLPAGVCTTRRRVRSFGCSIPMPASPGSAPVVPPPNRALSMIGISLSRYVLTKESSPSSSIVPACVLINTFALDIKTCSRPFPRSNVPKIRLIESFDGGRAVPKGMLCRSNASISTCYYSTSDEYDPSRQISIPIHTCSRLALQLFIVSRKVYDRGLSKRCTAQRPQPSRVLSLQTQASVARSHPPAAHAGVSQGGPLMAW